MNVTTSPGQYMLFKELIANGQDKKNYLLNNMNVMQMDKLEVSKCFSTGYDTNQLIPGIANLSAMGNTLTLLDLSFNKVS